MVDAYNLSYAALLMTGGTLADLLGRRRVLQAGAAVFVLGSLLAGLAPDIGVLIAARVLAGIGAALLLPASLALIRVIWADPHERAHAIGVWAGTNGAALAIGPTLGGRADPGRGLAHETVCKHASGAGCPPPGGAAWWHPEVGS